MTAKEKKKKPLRSQVKYPSLISRYNSRIRQEYLDADYLNKLDDTVANVKLPDGTMVTQLGYYAFFMKEWNNAEVGSQKKAKKNKFHRTKKNVKDCTDRNNKRNNDVYGIAKKDGKLQDINHNTIKEYEEKIESSGMNEVEDAMVRLIDDGRENYNEILKEAEEFKKKRPSLYSEDFDDSANNSDD